MSRHENEGKIPLYVVTHGGLSTGLKIAQTGHAVANFARFLPDRFHNWHRNSEYLIVLETENSDSLEEMVSKACEKGLMAVEFREPDLKNQLTAVAFPPDSRNNQLFRELKLAK